VATDKVRFYPEMGLAELSRSFRYFKKNPKNKSCKIAILSNFSTQFLTMGLELALNERRLNAKIFEAGYNQWEVELLDPNSALSSFKPDIILLTFSTELLAFRDVKSDAKKFAHYLKKLVIKASKDLGTKFFITLPTPIQEELDQTNWAYKWRKTLVFEMNAALEDITTLIDLDPLIRDLGASNWFSSRFFIAKKIPTNPEISARHADYLAQIIAATILQPIRLVIVDLDNTLWEGVVGEVGYEGVNLDIEDTGFNHIRIQRFLLGLYERGVLLAICSKNNAEDALEVFKNRPEMILKEDNFADIQINWDPKSENIKKIFSNLNLTEPGTVFLDDSPFERGEISSIFPEIWVPDFNPNNPDLVKDLVKNGHFTVSKDSDEDKKRHLHYSNEYKRNSLAKSQTDINDYYKSLNLILTPAPVCDANLQRVLDLLGKTNQFNLTTKRLSRSELLALQANNMNEIWTYQLKDRFGDYGIISVLIALRQKDTLLIDTWLMSCRAMGRTIENGILDHLIDRAQQCDVNEIIGQYIPTQKNKPVEKLYDTLGFKSYGGKSNKAFYKIDIKNIRPINDFVTIIK